VEAAAGRRRAVGVDGDDRVGVGLLPGASALVDARPHAVVVGAGEFDADAARGQPLLHPPRDVEGEGVLGVVRVGAGPGGVAGLRAAAAVRNRAVDRRGRGRVAAVVPGIEDDDACGTGRVARGGRRPASRRGTGGRAARRGAGRCAARRGAGRCARRRALHSRRRRGGRRRARREAEHGDACAEPDDRTTEPGNAAQQGGHAAKPATTTVGASRPARKRVPSRGDRECNRVSPICR
jgi:hypothetical protein